MTWKQIAEESCMFEMEHDRSKKIFFSIDGHSIPAPEAGETIFVINFKVETENDRSTIFTAYHKEYLLSPRQKAEFVSSLYASFDNWMVAALESIKEALQKKTLFDCKIPSPVMDELTFKQTS